MHLSNTTSIAFKKNFQVQQQKYGKFPPKTTILEHQNNKQKLQILEALNIWNMQPKLNRFNFRTSANLLKCL